MPADVSTPGPEDLDRRDPTVIPPYGREDVDVFARHPLAPQPMAQGLSPEQIAAHRAQTEAIGDSPPRTYDRSRQLSKDEISMLQESKRVADDIRDFVMLLHTFPGTPRGVVAAIEQPRTTTIDQRWLAIAETHFQQGLMAINRAIAKPEQW